MGLNGFHPSCSRCTTALNTLQNGACPAAEVWSCISVGFAVKGRSMYLVRKTTELVPGSYSLPSTSSSWPLTVVVYTRTSAAGYPGGRESTRIDMFIVGPTNATRNANPAPTLTISAGTPWGVYVSTVSSMSPQFHDPSAHRRTRPLFTRMVSFTPSKYATGCQVKFGVATGT